MYKIRLFLVSLFSLTLFGSIYAQNTQGKSQDFGRIVLSAVLPEDLNLTSGSKRLLLNKLYQICSRNGLGGGVSRHLLTCNVNEISKEFTATAPPMIVYDLELTFYIGDAVDKVLYTSEVLTLKGVGTNETKAYNSAFKRINSSSTALKELIDRGKSKILDYYNFKCEFIIQEAETLAQKKDFEQAIFKLLSVPKISKACYSLCMKKLIKIYQMKIDYECALLLGKAHAAWAAHNIDEASKWLAEINIDSKCYKDATTLINEIKASIKEQEDREWNLKIKEAERQHELKKQKAELRNKETEREHELNKQTLEAVHQVALQYTKSHPRQTYTLEELGW